MNILENIGIVCSPYKINHRKRGEEKSFVPGLTFHVFNNSRIFLNRVGSWRFNSFRFYDITCCTKWHRINRFCTNYDSTLHSAHLPRHAQPLFNPFSSVNILFSIFNQSYNILVFTGAWVFHTYDNRYSLSPSKTTSSIVMYPNLTMCMPFYFFLTI